MSNPLHRRLRSTLTQCLCGVAVALSGTAIAYAAINSGGSGRVVGKVRLCGGPAPGQCFTQRATVTAYRHHKAVAHTQTAQRGRFSLRLGAGRYLLIARSGGAQGQRNVAIRHDRTTDTRIVIPVH